MADEQGWGENFVSPLAGARTRPMKKGLIAGSEHRDRRPSAEEMAALKAYLEGEQYYRAARWDSAQFHFEHALAFDSTFAMAYHRLAAVRRHELQRQRHPAALLFLPVQRRALRPGPG